MAILINDNYSLQAQNKAFDARYLDVNVPWASCAAAIAGIPTYRYPGLTINISNVEWWWKDGILDGDLEQKTLGGTSNLSGATNGLSLFCSDAYIGLGGVLTQDTTICGGYGLGLGNIASGLTAISAVTSTFQIYDTGINSSLSFCHDQDTPHFDVCLYGENANSNADMVLDVDVVNGCFGVSTAPNTTCCSALSLRTTDSNVAIYNVHSTNNVMHYVKEACIASSKSTYESLTDSGNSALNIKSVMNYDTRSFEFCKDNSVILSILSGGTARYGSNVTLTNDCDLAHKWYVDNATGALSGANGLSKDGNNIVLGGELTGTTTISGQSRTLCFGKSSARYGQFVVESELTQIQGTSTYINGSDYVQLNGGNIRICLSNACGLITDNRVTKTGLEYAGNYENDFTARSLVTKQYVSGITSGITGAITSANNGLCVSGQIVSLGGTLTGDTTIGGDSNVMTFNNFNGFDITSVSATTCATTSMLLRTPSFIVHNGVGDVINISTTCNKLTDIVNSEGFVYAAQYCAAGKTNPRWIPDNQYVTGLTSGFINTASNGLTKDLQDVKLGGTLCENTDICLGGGAASQTFKIQNSGITTCSVLDMNGTTVSLCAANVNSPLQTGRVSVASSGSVICSGFAGCFSSVEMGNSIFNICAIGGASNASLTVTDDTSTPSGLEYAACYHGTYSDRSLVDKEYVTSQVSGITGAITTASNGLTKVGQDVRIGGDITTNTMICICDANYLIIGAPTYCTYTQITSGTTRTRSVLSTCSSDILGNPASVEMRALDSVGTKNATMSVCGTTPRILISAGNSGCTTQICLEPNTICVKGCAATFEGIKYCNDFSSNYTPRSLVDKEYVDTLVSGSTGAIGGANGLSKDGDNIVLGGSNITGYTEIIINDGANFALLNTGSTYMVEVDPEFDYVYLNTDSNEEYLNLEGSTGQAILGTTSGGYLELAGNANSCANITAGNSLSLCMVKAADTAILRTNVNGNNKVSLDGTAGCVTIMAAGGGTQPSMRLESVPDAIRLMTLGANVCLDGTGNTIHLDATCSIISGNVYLETTPSDDPDGSILVWNSTTCEVGKTTISTLGGITGATNGLCKVGQDVVLGGDLTGDTTIGGAYIMVFDNTAFNVSANTTIDGEFKLSSGTSVTFIETTLTNDDNRLPTSGAVYDAISSANINAGNGLTAVGTYVGLGGILTGATTISGGTQTLRLGHTSSLLSNLYIDASGAVQIQSGSIYMNAGTSANYKGGNFCMQLDNTNATFCDNSSGKDGLKYASCISTGFTNSCSVIDKGYVDDNSNIIAVCHVSSGYTTLCGDDLLAVSGISTNQINLYTTPKLGQRLTVVDICGNALADPIVVNGNGNLINNSACSTINTDYGSVTYVYNGIFWSAVAFIN